MSENMKVWDAVSAPDPEYVKNFRTKWGKEASTTNPQYLIMQATKQFGPVGVGWGYTARYEFANDMVLAFVSVWTGNRENIYGPVVGCNSFGKDDEAPKKAMTDALTKALSHLGFAADIFLGLWDDNKYVNGKEAPKASRGPKKGAKPKTPKKKASVVDKINAVTTVEKLPDIARFIAEKMPRGTPEEIAAYEGAKAAFKEKEKELT